MWPTAVINKQNFKIPQIRLGENKIKKLCNNLKILIKELMLTILHSYLMLCKMAQSHLSIKLEVVLKITKSTLL